MSNNIKSRKSQLRIPALLSLTIFILLVGSLNSCSKKDVVLPAFPGAEGYGAITPGGRYGRVIAVTNLNDTTNVNSPDYQGSLRWAVEQTWQDDPSDPYDQRRIIIFKVGGIIDLKESLIVKHPFVTVAGQTAPGSGITLKGDEFTIATHDVIVRGLKIRVGDEGTPTCCRDALSITTYYADTDVYNIIIDHNSLGWAVDENMSVWSEITDPYSIYNISIQWNIISEGLYNSIHIDEGATTTDPHSMGLIIGDKGSNMTVHHNLFARNDGRNPHVSGIAGLEIINNLVYGWGYGAFELGGYGTSVHLINNYFKAASNSIPNEIFAHDPPVLEDKVYISGNVAEDARAANGQFEARINNPSGITISTDFLFTPTGVETVSANDAYFDVLAKAGAIFPVRDAIDQRVVDQVSTGTGDLVNSQEQVGGWVTSLPISYPSDSDNDGIPDDWEIAHGSDPNNAADASTYTNLAPSGFTWIEEYINSFYPEVK